MRPIREWFRKASTGVSSEQDATLAERVKKAHAFFDPQNLADLLIEYKGEVGLVVIDVQKQYCQYTQETDMVSKRIQSLAPEFRKAGIPVYAVYFGAPQKDASGVDFYNFSPEPQDTLVAKNRMSAFDGGNIKEVLDRDHRKLLLVCGVYLDQCVRTTATDAVDQGFDVCLLRDLTGDHPGDTYHTKQSLSFMSGKGIAVMQSAQVLKALKISKAAAGGGMQP